MEELRIILTLGADYSYRVSMSEAFVDNLSGGEELHSILFSEELLVSSEDYSFVLRVCFSLG